MWVRSQDMPLSVPLRKAIKHVISHRRGLFGAALCALMLRMAVVCISYRAIANPTPDNGQFGAEMGWVARSIDLGWGFSSPYFQHTGPTALMPPLFPYLLAGVFHCFGLYTPTSAFIILSINALFSSLTCLWVYLCVKDVGGEISAELASWLWAIYPFAIFFSATEVWDYAITSFLFAACFCAAQRLHRYNRTAVWLGFGVLYGVSSLSNPSVLSMLPVLLVVAALRTQTGLRRRIALGLCAVLGFFISAGPWMTRNYLVMHSFSPVRDGFWHEFWAGNTGDTSESNPSWPHPASNPVEMQLFGKQGEVNYMAHNRAMALEHVRHYPIAFITVSLRRAIRFWTGFWSFRSSYLKIEPLDVPNVFFCSGVTLLMFRGMRRWWKVQRSSAIAYIFLIAVFPLPYYLTHSSMEYREPIEPEIVVLVTIGIFGFMGWNPSEDPKKIRELEETNPEPIDA